MIFKEENLESNTSTIRDPHFGILTVDTFDDQQQPIIPSHFDHSLKFWFRIKRMLFGFEFKNEFFFYR
jgi:hypothetical protein